MSTPTTVRALEYRVRTSGFADLLGPDHPYAHHLEPGEASLTVVGPDDGRWLEVIHSRRPDAALFFDTSRGKAWFYDRIRRARSPEEGYPPWFECDEWESSDADDRRFEIDGISAELTTVTGTIPNAEVRVGLAEELLPLPLSDLVARVVFPFRPFRPGLPAFVHLLTTDGNGSVDIELVHVGQVPRDDPDTHEWSVLPADQFIGLPIVESEVASRRRGKKGAESGTLRTRTSRLSAAQRPDFAWIVRQSNLDSWRENLNRMLDPISEIDGSLDGLTFDWWNELSGGMDDDASAFRAFARLALVTRVFQQAPPEGDGIPEWLRTLWTRVRNPGELMRQDEVLRYVEFQGDLLDPQVDDPIPNRADVLPLEVDALCRFWLDFFERQPQRLARLFAYLAAIGTRIQEREGLAGGSPLDSSDLQSRVAARFQTLADDLWASIRQEFGASDMPGAPLELALTEDQRKVKRTIAASDVSDGINLPGWLDKLAVVRMTLKEVRVEFPKDKVRSLTFDEYEDEDDRVSDAVRVALAVDLIRVKFSYSSVPAFSVASVVGWLVTGGQLALAVTAAGNGAVKLRDVSLPIALVPAESEGRLAYEVFPEKAEIDDISLWLVNFVPALASQMVVLLAWLWAEYAGSFVEDLETELLAVVPDIGDLTEPFAWPRKWRGQAIPDLDEFELERDVAIEIAMKEALFGGRIGTDDEGFIQVDVAGTDATVRYLPDESARLERVGSGLPPGDLGFAFSLRYLEAWLLRAVGLPSEYQNQPDIGELLDDANIDLPPVDEVVDEEVEDSSGFIGPSREGVRIPGVGFVVPPAGPKVESRRIQYFSRGSPIFSLPTAGEHDYALRILQRYSIRIEDVRQRSRFVPRVTPERCFMVPDFDRPPALLESILVREIDPDRILHHDLHTAAGEVALPLDSVASPTPDESQPRIRSLSIPGPDGNPGAAHLVCFPAEYEWVPHVTSTPITTYLSAHATVEAHVRVGFSPLGDPTIRRVPAGPGLLHFLFELRHRLQSEGLDFLLAEIGWLPSIGLEAINIGEGQSGVVVTQRAGPFADLEMSRLNDLIIAACVGDVREWLAPIRGEGNAVYDWGGFVSESAARVIDSFAGQDPWVQLTQPSAATAVLSVGQSANAPAPPRHQVTDDYVYLALDALHGLGNLFGG